MEEPDAEGLGVGAEKPSLEAPLDNGMDPEWQAPRTEVPEPEQQLPEADKSKPSHVEDLRNDRNSKDAESHAGTRGPDHAAPCGSRKSSGFAA